MLELGDRDAVASATLIMRNVKLCIVTPVHWDAEMGGAEYQIKLLVETLAARGGYDMSYLARSISPGPHTDAVSRIRIRTPKFINRYGWFFDAPGLYRELRQLRPDCIYQRVGCAYTGVVAYYARQTGCRVVWHVAQDGDVMRMRPVLNRRMVFEYVEKKCLEFGVARVGNIVVQTERQRELVRANYSRHSVAVIPNFHPFPNAKITKQHRPVRILWVANLKPVKRPELFVRLARDLADRGDVELTMLGSPDHQQARHERFLLDLSRVPTLRYLGAVSQEAVNERLAQSHLLVNTSLMEGFSNTFIQAWMRKVPVLSLGVDPDGVIATHRIGLVAEEYGSLLRNTRQLIEHDALRNEMGNRAQAYAFKTHSMKNVDQLIALLHPTGGHRMIEAAPG